MTCEKSRIRDLMRVWQISFVGKNALRETKCRERIEHNLLKFKTGAKKIKWLHDWAEGKTAVRELEDAS